MNKMIPLSILWAHCFAFPPRKIVIHKDHIEIRYGVMFFRNGYKNEIASSLEFRFYKGIDKKTQVEKGTRLCRILHNKIELMRKAEGVK